MDSMTRQGEQDAPSGLEGGYTRRQLIEIEKQLEDLHQEFATATTESELREIHLRMQGLQEKVAAAALEAALEAEEVARRAPAVAHGAPSSSPVSDPTAAAVLSGGGGGRAEDEGTGGGLRTKRKAEAREVRLLRRRGAVFANSRTDEGFVLASGRQESCLVDAVFNGMAILLVLTGSHPDSLPVTLTKLRRACIPELGNVRQATWRSCKDALVKFDLPFQLIEATRLFSNGPPMLLLLNAPPAVFIVGLCVTIGGEEYNHSIVLSTVPEERAPHGKMMDNGNTMRPVYIEARDKEHKVPAKLAFKTLLKQKIKHDDFSVYPTDVYELRLQ